jgi:hypothetical protein
MDRASSLRRAQELTAELVELVEVLRVQLADESSLPKEDMRHAFTAARASALTGRQRRWSDVLLTDP